MIIGQISLRQRYAIAAMLLAITMQAEKAAAENSSNEFEDHALDEIIVEGVPLDRTVKELAQPASVVDGDELAKRQSASIGETLSQELGMSSSYFGPVSSRPVIRGQYGERIRVLSNGLDAMDAAALSEDHAVGVDSALAESIEIIRGPATLLYGSGAAGGLVNVVDDRILENGLDEAFGGRLFLGSDSATGRQSFAGKVAFGNERVGVHFDYFRRDTDDVEIPGFAESALLRALEEESATVGEDEEEAFGVVENTASESEGGAAAVTISGANGFVGISLSRYDNFYGIPGHHHEEEGGAEAEEEENVRVDLSQSRFDLKGEYEFEGLGELRLKLASNDYGHVELEGDEIGTRFESDGTDARLEFRHRPFGNVEGAFGLQVKDVDFAAIGDEAFVPGSSTQQISLFGFEEWQPGDDWTVQGSARLESQTIKAAALPKYDDNAYGVSVGLIRTLGESHSVAFNIALTERHPNATELYADGAHVAVQRVERGSVIQGNGLLDKETSSNIDLTLRGENSRLSWTLTAFLNDIDDYILLAPTAMEEDELQVFEYSQTDARLYGFEAEARIELLDTAVGHLHTRLFTDYVSGKDDNSGQYLPQIPPLRYGIGLHYTKEGFEATVEARFHADQDDIAPSELPTDSYTLLSAGLSYQVAEPDVFVFLRGTNLSDEDARQHTSPLKDIVPLPGRSLQLGVRYDF
ncbi:MAG: TonB-dependent receptor [Woeseiaceae bacterium]|nr:TonB-dependent receptor [Woeseiaceae bacterium]